ncbi:MAG TPA: V4R domain-containing protein [Candidatus Bathyarchaeia archaeon]|nr:V4R domain-containing protein [Candidatus Bathyarchaeia archaeon]
MNQLRFNDNRGEVSFFGQKMIILRRDVIRVMREALERMVGDQAAPFLSFLASGIGVHEGSIFRDSVTTTGNEARASLDNLVHSAFEDTNLGLGKIQIRKVDFDRSHANIVISNCFEAIENGQSEEPNCMFTSGFLAGLFAEVFDTTLQAKETRCISQGSTECEFSLFPVDPVSGEPIEQPEARVETPATKSEPAQPKEPPASPKQIVEALGTTKGPPEIAKPSSKIEIVQETKPSDKPAAPIAVDPTKKEPEKQASETKRSEVDAGVERASRIAKRKQGFWERHFKKN